MTPSKPFSSFKKIGILVVLLIMPTAIFYFLVYAGVHKVNRLKIYGPKEIVESSRRGATVYDTVYHSVQPVPLTDLKGRPFNMQNLAGKIYLVHFIDHALLDDIPKEIVFDVADFLPGFKELLMVSIFENYDSAKVIPKPSERSRKLQNEDEKWIYLTGDSAHLFKLKFEGYFKADPQEPVKLDPYSLVLVDRDARVRGYYNPIMLKEINEMKKEISMLYKEYELALKGNKYIRFN
jgi:hypothetical protein